MYANVIRILSKGYLPVSLLPQTKLQEILNDFKKPIQISSQDYDIIIKSLCLYYDMKLIIYGIYEERNLIVMFFQFPHSHTYNNSLYCIKLKWY